MNAKEMIFLRDVVPAAQTAQRATGIPASITIAQAILESGWGMSGLTKKANNYFGIKAIAHASAKQYTEFPTSEFVNGQHVKAMARFARYPSPAACFAAHTQLISNDKRYAPALAVKNDPHAFANAIQHCGYSTNPHYADGLMQLVKQFDLTQYDIVSPQAQAASTVKPAEQKG